MSSTIEINNYVLLTFFPESICFTQYQQTKSNKIYIKYHFVPACSEVFDAFLNQYFNEGEYEVFIEQFHDTQDFQYIKQSHWKKSVGIIENDQFKTLRTTEKNTSSFSSSNNTLRYTETKHSPALIENHVKTITLNVERMTYYSKINKSVRIKRDFVEFQDGDLHCIYTLQAELDETKWQEQLVTTQSQFQSKPVRTKITEYLYRHHPTVYHSLEQSNRIPFSMDFGSTYLIPKQTKYHPNGMISQWRKKYLKHATILSTNLGINVESLLEFNVNPKSWFVFNHFTNYSPETISIFKESLVNFMTFQCYFDQTTFFISEEMQKKLEQVKGQVDWFIVNIFGYYCIDLFVKENEKQIKEFFEREIEVGFVRILYECPKITSDLNHAKYIVSMNGELLKLLPENLRLDKEIVKLAAQQNFMSLRHAPYNLRRNSDFIKELVQIQGLSLIFAHHDLFNDSEIVLKAVQQNGWLIKSSQLSEMVKLTKLSTSAYFQRLKTLENIAANIPHSSCAEFSIDAKECLIQIYDHEEKIDFRLHMRFIMIPVHFLKKEEGECDLL